MGNGQNKQLDEGWALVAGDFCMQQGLWPSLSSFYIILPSTSTLKKNSMISSSPHPTNQEMSWSSRFPEPVDIKQFGPIRDQAKSHPGFTRGVRQVGYQAPPCHLFVTVTGRWSIPRYTIMQLHPYTVYIYLHILSIHTKYVYRLITVYFSDKSSQIFKKICWYLHWQTPSTHALQHRRFGQQAPHSLAPQRYKKSNEPWCIENEAETTAGWSGRKWIQKIAQHSGWLEVDFIPTGFLLNIFLLPWMHARHSPPLWCFCGYKGRDFSQARHPNHGSSISSNTLYLYYIFIYNSCICNHIHIPLVHTQIL